MFAFGSWQGTAGSQRLELTVANVGTTGYHCKELPVPRGWNSWFPTGNHGLPLQATAGYQRWELMLPTLGTIGYHCKELPFPKGWNWRFPTWEQKQSMLHSTLHSTNFTAPISQHPAQHLCETSPPQSG